MSTEQRELGEAGSEYRMAETAASLAVNGMDTKSHYGVGAVLRLDNGNTHNGFNVRFSGMEYTVHAEQLAMFQAILDLETCGLDIEVEPERMVVVTNSHDGAIVCGHCLQVISGIYDHYNWDKSELEYTAAKYTGEEERVRHFHCSAWEFDRHTLDELLPETYVERRS